MNIDSLNTRFARDNECRFYVGKGSFPAVEINNRYARAQVSLYGGQLLSFQPKQGEELLFVSESAFYTEGKAIKGGVPICWPWFGDDPEGLGRPAHGFVRNRVWDVENVATTEQGETEIMLGLVDTKDTRALWPYAFHLQLTMRIGESLSLMLTTTNMGSEVFSLSQALHSYFAIDDITHVAVDGLQGIDYIDKTSNESALMRQQGAVSITGEVDRIYLNPPSVLQIIQVQKKQTIHLASSGSHSVVVWNPWAAIARSMADLREDDYQRFICVETSNAGTDVVRVPAGALHTLGVIIHPLQKGFV